MLTGYGVYLVTGNWTPFWVSAFICAVFIGGYEYMIANPSTEDGQ
jgi:hypothetical protein